MSSALSTAAEAIGDQTGRSLAPIIAVSSLEAGPGPVETGAVRLALTLGAAVP